MKTHGIYISIICLLILAFVQYEWTMPERISVLRFNNGVTEIGFKNIFGWGNVNTNASDCDDYSQCLQWYDKYLPKAHGDMGYEEETGFIEI